MPVDPLIGRFNRSIEEHATEVGLVVQHWNTLQERLGSLFVTLIDARAETVGWAIWHSLRSDLAQREMLLAASSTMFAADEEHQREMRSDIEWLLREVNVLSDQRNNAIHSPIQFLATHEDMLVVPVASFGNRRAQKLEGKELRAEFARCHLRALDLTTYCYGLFWRVLDPEELRPSRPQRPDQTIVDDWLSRDRAT